MGSEEARGPDEMDDAREVGRTPSVMVLHTRFNQVIIGDKVIHNSGNIQTGAQIPWWLRW